MNARAKPLEGVRVLAQAIVWAGPYATLLLSDLGAEVIEIESIQHLNPTRTNMRKIPPVLLEGRTGASYLNRDGSEGFWNRQAWFNYGKRGCKSVTLDLNRPEGREVFFDLAREADAFIENNAWGVVERLGIDWPKLCAVNPRLIMVRFPGFGIEGPYRHFKGYGANMEAVAGHTMSRGYDDADPSLTPPIFHGDPNAGAHVAWALQAALVARERTGRGQLIEIAQMEAVAHHVTFPMMDYVMNGRVAGQRGNHHPWMAPYGVFPAAGHDRWIAIAVEDDAAFAALCHELGRPELAADERFADAARRHTNRGAINAIVSEWTAGFDAHELARRLQAAGVAAVALEHQEEMVGDPHLQARGYFEPITHPEAGTHRYPGVVARFQHVPLHEGLRPAPTLGQHNEEILKGLLGYSDERYQQLLDSELIGTTYLETADAG